MNGESMKIIMTTNGGDPIEADQAILAGSPHRQVYHTLVALPVGSTIVLTIPAPVLPEGMPVPEGFVPEGETVLNYVSEESEDD
jgi:hypothetical protein